jgi:hypothetical protein
MAYSQSQIDQLFDSICKRVENGEALRKVLKSIPLSSETFYRWVDADESKSKQYARSLELRAELKFESIEDDYSQEPQRDAETGRIDPAWVNLQRLKIDAKKWELSKMLPKKYGDKVDIDHTTKGEAINIPVININAPK